MNHPKTQMQSCAKMHTAGMPEWSFFSLLFVFVAMLLVLAPAAWSQDNATITGAVTDASGSVVPNAAITLMNPATGQTRDTVSNGVGAYRFANVGVGTPIGAHPIRDRISCL